MMKLTLIPVMISLVAVSQSNAATMSTKERVAVARRLEKIAPFAGEKYLPANFVKEIEKRMKSDEDKAQFKKLNSEWPKQYAKHVMPRVTGNSYAITFKGSPVISVKIASLKPFTVQINNGKEAVIRSGHYFADMGAALKAAGYNFNGKAKKSAFFSLLPEAFADEAGYKSIENSVFLLGGDVYAMNEDGSLQLATSVTQARTDWKHVFGGNLSEVKCNGQNFVGTFTSGNSKVEFSVDRNTGIRMSIDGQFNLLGTASKSQVSKLCQAANNAELAGATNAETMGSWKNQHALVCQALMQLRPTSGLNCITAADLPVADYKAECAKMADMGILADYQLQQCKSATECTPLNPEDVTIADLYGRKIWENEVPLKLSQIEMEFVKEMGGDNPMIKREGNEFIIVPPDRLKASRAKKLREMLAAVPAKPTPAPSKPQVSFRDMAIAANGMLDCCYDTKCKAELLDKSGIDMVPAESAQ